MVRRTERVLRVVGRSRGEVVRHEEALEPTTVVTDFYRGPRKNFVLNGRTELPVGRTNAPALEDRGIDRRRRQSLTKSRLLPWTALAVGRRVHQVALGSVVAVDAETAAIVPRPVGRAREARRTSGVHELIAILVVRRLQIP